MDYNNSTTPENERDLAQTPPWFVKGVELQFNIKFDLDTCCLANTAKCDAYYSLIDHGVNSLIMPWGLMNWCNPPYSNITPWVSKAVTESMKGKTSFLLMPDKAEVGYTIQTRLYADTIIHMPFRLQFLKPDGTEFLDDGGKKQGPKFSVMLAIFTTIGLNMPVRDRYFDFRIYR